MSAGLAVLLLAGTAGCPEFGAWLYTLGMVPEQKVEAEYKLPEGPLLILVDDDLDLIQPPLARDELVDTLATELKAHEVADRVTTNEEIARVRQAESDFDRLSIREVGRRVKADTVLWISVEDFFVEQDLEMMVRPARFAVKLKVFDVKEEDRRRIRLWPPEREGRFVSLTVSPHDLRECQNMAEAHKKLSTEMADTVAKLFYDYTIENP